MCDLGPELGFNPAVTLTAEVAASDLLGGFLSHSWGVGDTEGGAHRRA